MAEEEKKIRRAIYKTVLDMILDDWEDLKKEILEEMGY